MCNTRAIRICSRRIKVLARWWNNACAEKCRPGTTQRCSGPTRGLIRSAWTCLKPATSLARKKRRCGYTVTLPHRSLPGFDMTVITQEDLIQSVADALQ